MAIDPKTFQRYAADPAAFRAEINVDVDGTARKFGDVMDPWQRADFQAVDPALMACNGRKPDCTAKTRAYLERGRGSSKTTDLAVTVCWAMAFAMRPLKGYAFAADRDQSRLLRDAVQTIVRLNPWLAGILTVEAHRIVNTASGHPGEGGALTIEASDVGSSYGILPDIIICDELVHWEGDGSLWHSLISSAAKRTHCLLVVISNAGFAESWQWAVREAARTDANWIFSRLDGPVASWLSPKRLEEQRRMLPAVAYERLVENRWASAGGDALTEEVIRAAFHPDRQPQSQAAHGYEYVGGLDLGISRDASAVVILGIRRGREGHGMIRAAHLRIWRPTKGRKVDLQEVEDALADLHGRFNLRALDYDPWQAQHLASRLQAGGLSVYRSQLGRLHGTSRVPMVEIPQSGPNLQRMATTLIEAFNDHRVELYENADLRRDLTRFRIEERSYGFRLVSPKDQHGHGDVGSAFCLALLAASELAAKRKLTAGVAGSDRELTPWQKAQAKFRTDAEAYAKRQLQLHEMESGEQVRGFVDALRQNRPL